MSFTGPEWVALVTARPPPAQRSGLLREEGAFAVSELDCLCEIHYSFESLAEFIGYKSNTFEQFAGIVRTLPLFIQFEGNLRKYAL